MQLYPAIDMKNGKCVRLRQGEFKDVTVYSDCPEEVACKWQEQGATFFHLVDLDGALAGHSVNEETLRRIVSSVSIPVEQPEFLRKMAEKFGAEAIVAGIDAKNGNVAVQGWEQVSSVMALKLAQRMRDYGIKHIVYTDISRDGMLSGPNVEAAKRLTKETGLDVIASGGVSSMEDLQALYEAGIKGAIIGKALYENRIDLSEAVRRLEGRNDYGRV